MARYYWSEKSLLSLLAFTRDKKKIEHRVQIQKEVISVVKRENQCLSKEKWEFTVYY
jgi:hypothetical protein